MTRQGMRITAAGGWILSAGAGCWLLAVTPVAAQEIGRSSQFEVGLGLDAGKNLDLDPGVDDSSAELRGTFGYSYYHNTRNTQLSFKAKARPLRSDNGYEGSFPQADLTLSHSTSRAELKFSAQYQEVKVDDQSIGYDDTGSVLTYDGTGTRQLSKVDLGLTGGVDMPFGYQLDLNRSTTDYRDVSSSSSYASTALNAARLALRADISPMTRATLNAGAIRYRADDARRTERDTYLMSLGIRQRVDMLTSLYGEIGYSDVETRRTTGDEDTNGAIFSLGAVREDRLGGYSLRYSRRITENGARDELLIARQREGRLGKLEANLGLSNSEENGTTDWIGQLNYVTELKRQTLTLDASRAVRTDNDGDDVVVTRLTGNIRHDLNDFSGLNFGLVGTSNEQSDNDQLRVDASVAWDHDLTQDVSFTAGAKLALLQKETTEDADSQSLFFNITRSFQIGQ